VQVHKRSASRLIAVWLVLVVICPANAQHEHSGSSSGASVPQATDHTGTNHAGMEHGEMMQGFYGPYAMSREASGTSWQPEGTPMPGVHIMSGDWMFMIHGFVFGIYDYQEGDRGDEKIFSENMLMFMGTRPVGAGRFGFRTMFSIEPATIGRSGYPELLQTGETGTGTTPLIDRQHPHDFFGELALTYNLPVGEESALFAYFGIPGEPALGPPTYSMRFSGMDNPEAPITHHWLDSTHITFGVATLGVIWKQFKLDGSLFTGREPDEERWNFDRPRFDSQSVRLSFNPNRALAFQVSYGNIHSPEQIEPEVDTERITASVVFHKSWEHVQWQTTFAWGQNRNDPGRVLDGFLLESAVNFHEQHTVFGRFERVEKDELFPPGDPFEDRRFTVHKLSLGYVYDFPEVCHMKFGIGGVGSAHFLPDSLDSTYGDTPLSFMVFVRAKL
jgi:hypothetical protein